MDAERFDRLEEDVNVLMVALRVASELLPAATRRTIREQACQALEAIYEEEGIKPHAHLRLQRMLHDMEQLFPSGPLDGGQSRQG
jgi:propanediol dehydratase large subunit